MKPILFPEANMPLRGGNTGALDMPVHLSPCKQTMTSCWELSTDEIRRLLVSKKLYITVYGMHPPILPSVLAPGEVDAPIVEEGN